MTAKNLETTPFISVIVPVYNVEPYVEACLKSVMDQVAEGLEIECIVVDDCGTDHSMDVVQRAIENYNGPIDFKILRHEHNKGLSGARNTALRAAKGEYVFFLDSDDILLPQALCNLAKLAQKYPGVEIVQGEMQLSVPDGGMAPYLNVSAIVVPEYLSGHKKARHALLFDTPVTACGKLIKLDFIVRNVLFFEEGMIHEDDMWAVSASRYIKDIAYYFTPVYWYNNDNDGSIINTSDKTRSMSGCLKIVENALGQFEKEPCRDYLDYLDQRLDIKIRMHRWPYVLDKFSVKQQMSSLRKTISSSSLPSAIKQKYAFFSSNEKICFNPYFRFIAKHIFLRKLRRQSKRYKM